MEKLENVADMQDRKNRDAEANPRSLDKLSFQLDIPVEVARALDRCDIIICFIVINAVVARALPSTVMTWSSRAETANARAE